MNCHYKTGQAYIWTESFTNPACFPAEAHETTALTSKINTSSLYLLWRKNMAHISVLLISLNSDGYRDFVKVAQQIKSRSTTSSEGKSKSALMLFVWFVNAFYTTLNRERYGIYFFITYKNLAMRLFNIPNINTIPWAYDTFQRSFSLNQSNP